MWNNMMVAKENEMYQKPCSMPKITDEIIEITCGPLTARMHTKLFLCPGIHTPCIELEGEMISPKQLTFRANKDRQKDWKGSIRIGKNSLRSLIAIGSFDFYNHMELCSAKCQSRNYINPKLPDFAGMQALKSTTSMTMLNPMSGAMNPFVQNAMNPMMFPTGVYGAPPMLPRWPTMEPAPCPPVPPCASPGLPSPTAADSIASTIEGQFPPQAPTPDQQLLNLLHMDPITFWRELQRVGIMEDVIDQMAQSLGRFRNAPLEGCNGSELIVSMTLSRLVVALNMQPDVISRVHEHQWQFLNNMRTEQLEQFPIDVIHDDKEPDVTNYGPSLSQLDENRKASALMELLGKSGPSVAAARSEPTQPTSNGVSMKRCASFEEDHVMSFGSKKSRPEDESTPQLVTMTSL